MLGGGWGRPTPYTTPYTQRRDAEDAENAEKHENHRRAESLNVKNKSRSDE